ncbi:MAG: 1-acyl-sn-glycerol-3-phosphate acyltransferase, partial [Gammaproteobacteria bacterium]|nr:1-acyl-sn-glycerol-3-phosphate acyltransferase [Gammaproteobacteria bacterium]
MTVPEILVIIFFVVFAGFVFIGYKNHVADWGGFTLNVIDGWIRIYCRYYHGFIYQPIPVSDNKAALLACNHLSGLDPFLIVAACRRPIRFMIAKEEYERFGLQWLFRAAGCIPVERSGRVETAFRASLSALHNGEVVALFPEGGINRTGRPLRKLKAGIIKLAKMANVPITALRVEGMRGQGHTVTAVLLASQSRLYVLPELDC